MMKLQPESETCDSILTPSKLRLDKYSHTISKIKPKIRIIHIVAPEIIKTDVQNFRELVQRLTGKPTTTTTTTEARGISTEKMNNSKPRKKMESQEDKHRMKKDIREEMLYGGGHNSNGFLSFLGDVESFINIDQDLNEFHLPPFRSSSQMNMFGY
ncbi:VQ motif-containing protein motif-containing protein 25 [Forsythia ovata]|uniref:VQ motif-containing protein motif-containing protein 25 n=1 Tax=Forsythia ovata TaxID=205694 RepID=A0ABD1QQQ8_9LAMI